MRLVEVAGTRLCVRESGAGPLALFIHGFPLDSTMWLDQLTALGSSRHCVAPDLRGFGASDPTTDPILTMERHADDLAALVGALGYDRADVVALSMGGYIALALWERHRQVVRSLALLDTRSEADDQAGRTGREETVQQVLREGRGALADQMLATLLAEDASWTARARLRTMAEGLRYETVVAALLGMRDRPDRTGLLSSIDVPALVVAGEHDTVTDPDTMRSMAEAISGARFETIDGAAHLTPIERPQAVDDLLASFWG